MSGWNYRMVSRDVDGDEVFIAIHEVYYDDNNRPYMLTAEPVGIAGDSIEEIRRAMEDYQKALDKPVLRYGDIVNESRQPSNQAHSGQGRPSRRRSNKRQNRRNERAVSK